MRPRSTSLRLARYCRYLITMAAISISTPQVSQASWLDSDFYCRVYGCVVIHDGYTFDVYDNYVFSTGGTVAPGQPMIPWTGNPFEGAGGVNPVITGSRTEGFHAVPLEDQSIVLGIDTNGDGIADRLPSDLDGSGFMDAGDDMGAFNLSATTNLVSATTSAQRSFYLSSRTDFYLAAQAKLVGPMDSLNQPSRLSNIALRYDITRSGNDDGMSFGSDARNGRFYRMLNNVDDLGDIYGAPVEIVEFRRDIRRRDSASLPAQSIRFDYVYGFENYDLSMGDGHLRYEIEFDVYNR